MAPMVVGRLVHAPLQRGAARRAIMAPWSNTIPTCCSSAWRRCERRSRCCGCSSGAPVDVYLVGGAVRDLMLGCEPRELDLVVEDELEPFIARIGAARKLHDRFATAKLTLEGFRVRPRTCAPRDVRPSRRAPDRGGGEPRRRPGPARFHRQCDRTCDRGPGARGADRLQRCDRGPGRRDTARAARRELHR